MADVIIIEGNRFRTENVEQRLSFSINKSTRGTATVRASGRGKNVAFTLSETELAALSAFLNG